MPTKGAILFFASVLLLGGRGSGAGQTQTDLTAQACSGFEKADSELNRVYQRILATNAGDAAFVKALRAAQRAWIVFRDAHVQSIYPDPDPMAYGSVHPMCRCVILTELTIQRSKQLRELWIDGTVEGDVCAGSARIKSQDSGSPARNK